MRLHPLLATLALAASAFACGPTHVGDGRGDCLGGKCDDPDGPPTAERYLHLVHFDGCRPDVFRAMLDAGQLPHFEYLLSRGKVSYRASTVDKSETMKVIQSYLTGRFDTEVVGWWQWSRDDLRFRNYWLDPAEVVNYALGLEFPLRPTVLDFLDDQGRPLTAGMSLARRGVPFDHYGRSYYEGATAVSRHTYYEQAHATMTPHREILERIAADPSQKLPALGLTLLAPADELAHAEGVASLTPDAEYCFEDEGVHTPIFRILAEDADADGHLERLVPRYFSDVETSFWSGAPKRLCIRLPELAFHAEAFADGLGTASMMRVAPRYALAMILVDIEMGKLIDTLRGVRLEPGGGHRFAAPGDLLAYIDAGRAEDTLFERTLFIIFGDHGMVDTKHYMSPVRDAYRSPGSLDVAFLDYLDGGLGLATLTGAEPISAGTRLGVDYQRLPARLKYPHKFKDWQGPEIALLTDEAEAWAASFFTEIKEALSSNLHERYWWLLFLRGLVIDPRLDAALDPVAETARDMLAQLYLRGEPAYLAAEAAATRAFYDRHVRLVYGGGALNNAELFLPVCDDADACAWGARPTFAEIMAYTGGQGTTTVVDRLRANPGVGLIFVRKNNEELLSGAPPPDETEILVLDRAHAAGTISVRRDADSGQLVFHYRVEPGSPGDPLAMGDLGMGGGTLGTYDEWNALSIEGDHYYHNVVGGLGTYLASANPAIGDVVVMHSQGWNFGDNAGGHGGVHKEEKLTLMLVSGPGVGTGEELMARARWRSLPDGSVVPVSSMRMYPTLVDVAPTALAWLGYGEQAFADFAQRRFAGWFAAWAARQRADILANLSHLDDLTEALHAAGFDDLRIDRFRDRLERLFRFVGATPPLPAQDGLMDGNRLILR